MGTFPAAFFESVAAPAKPVQLPFDVVVVLLCRVKLPFEVFLVLLHRVKKVISKH